MDTATALGKSIIFAIKDPRPADVKELNSFCLVQMSLGEKYFMPLRELRRNLASGKVISDPHAPLEYRWGAQSKPYKARCKTY